MWSDKKPVFTGMQPWVYINFFKCNSNVLEVTRCFSYNRGRMREENILTGLIREERSEALRYRKGRYLYGFRRESTVLQKKGRHYAGTARRTARCVQTDHIKVGVRSFP